MATDGLLLQGAREAAQFQLFILFFRSFTVFMPFCTDRFQTFRGSTFLNIAVRQWIIEALASMNYTCLWNGVYIHHVHYHC